MAVNDVTDYIAEEYKKTNRVPTIKEQVAKKVVKSTKVFYKLFPRGLTQACEAANVPPPTTRIEAVKNAVKNRKQSRKQTQSTETKEGPEQLTENERLATNAPTAGPFLALVTEKEKEATDSRSQLELLQRLDRAKHDDAENKRQIQTIENIEIARKMHVSFANYDKGMRHHYETHPELQRQVLGTFSKLGWGANFDKHFTEVIGNQYSVSNHLDTTLPEIWRKMGVPRDMPADPDFAAQQWEFIMENLTSFITAQELTEIETKIRNFRADFRCNMDGRPLRHLGGSSFTCTNGHPVCFPCPVCKSPLTYNTDGFSCATCRGRTLRF